MHTAPKALASPAPASPSAGRTASAKAWPRHCTAWPGRSLPQRRKGLAVGLRRARVVDEHRVFALAMVVDGGWVSSALAVREKRWANACSDRAVLQYTLADGMT